MIKIMLNGKEKEFTTIPNLKILISQYCTDSQPVIAELNGQIVKKQTWEHTPVSPGDTIELVSMVGGG